MKKVVVASILGASLFGANAGISHAQDCPQGGNVQVQPQQGQSNADINKLIESLKKQGFDVQTQNVEQKQQQAPAQEKTQTQAAPQQQKASEAPKSDAAAGQLTADEKQMVDKVNQEREKAGVKPLQVDMELTKMARVKAQDMIDNNYFDHNSPKYGSPFDMMNKFGIQYQTAGENIAGNSSVDGAHTSLMNSQGHRENILKSDYTKVGIGIVDGGKYGKMFVQEFTG
ncbi:CAP domain-containing protein [Fictibacillus sp. KU28468]|uniref:CAP domain-containing protein n=1 Tax=Fictibacillus sp. KU28468 TaxID=2991053 RepID=UPI00223CB584|nr:CAP domain-containing protein [Fictibacillus sp. KU28468]UZJ78130.1 CAP domain-containing protein [Fictibacillus sp. KU28468]